MLLLWRDASVRSSESFDRGTRMGTRRPGDLWRSCAKQPAIYVCVPPCTLWPVVLRDPGPPFTFASALHSAVGCCVLVPGSASGTCWRESIVVCTEAWGVVCRVSGTPFGPFDRCGMRM